MPGTMSEADLVADLKESLHDTAEVFAADGDPAFKRFLRQALPDMGFKRPLTKLGQVSLLESESRYTLASYPDFSSYKTHLWGTGRAIPKPWENGYPGALPRVSAVNDGTGWGLMFDPAPTLVQIAALGATFKFWYYGQHAIGVAAADTTVAAQDRSLLLLRAQVEAMRELAIHQANKPVSMRDGLSGAPRNSTPAALHEALLRLFQEAR